jgi:hypothetical protein
MKRVSEMVYKVQTTKADVRNALVEYFQDKSDWRRMKAEQYPHDGRNHESQLALAAVAGYCKSLSDDSDLLARLLMMQYYFSPEGEVIGDAPEEVGCSAPRIAIRCGFDGQSNPADFLEEWVEALEMDYPAYRKWLSEHIR